MPSSADDAVQCELFQYTHRKPYMPLIRTQRFAWGIIDVQGKLLFYVVAAWEDDFTGYVVDYGSYPDQQRTYFTLRDARHTLASASEGTGLEGSIYAGLESLTDQPLWRSARG